jgi:hypothetical protein
VNYDVKDHPMLSDKAKALFNDASEKFTEHHREAENLLGLDGRAFKGEKANVAKIAVAIQINYQIETGLGFFMNRNSPAPVRGGSVFHRGDNRASSVHPSAQQMVDSIMATDSSRVPIITSLRGPR